VAWPTQDPSRAFSDSIMSQVRVHQLRLDGIICCVDAKHIEMQLYETRSGGEAAQQIAFADRILLNKTDLLLGNKRVNNNNNNNVNNNDDDDDDNHDNGMEDHILQVKDTIRGSMGQRP